MLRRLIDRLTKAVPALPAAKKAVEARRDAAIADAVAQARRTLRVEARAYARRSVRAFIAAMFAKLIIVLFALVILDVVDAGPVARMGVLIVLFIAFVVRDVLVARPTVRWLSAALSRHGWRPREALSETFAAEVAAEVARRGATQAPTLTAQIALALSGASHDDLVAEVANRTAEEVRAAAWPDVKPLAISAAVRLALAFAAYSAFLTWITTRAF